MQRNFIATYLNGSRGGKQKDAALVAVVAPNPEDWRFSLVRMDYKLARTASGDVTAKAELSSARRYSFLVGQNEDSHTAQTCFLPLLQNDKTDPTLDDLEKAFGIEKVTKEFFESYRELFHKTTDALNEIVAKDAAVGADFDSRGVKTTTLSAAGPTAFRSILTT